LCCVAPPFARSADFAIDKPAGVPCPHLGGDARCGIHADLRGRGFPGCTVFDCFGAGQQLTQVTFAGVDWRRTPQLAGPLFAALPVVRRLRELLWHLAEARTRPEAAPMVAEVTALEDDVTAAAGSAGEDLPAVDLDALHARAGDLLGRVSEAVRAGVPQRAADRRGADLVGAALRGASLRGASLRGALLIGADLRGADLQTTDLLGADLRAADLRGADLRDSLFLTVPQLTAARGDAATRLPSWAEHPAHWGA
jgi:uncharacterized protein YjbI with pentapeptide repeats